MTFRVIALAFIAVCLFATPATVTGQEKAVEAYRVIKPSLALIATYRDERLLKTGTGFCVSSAGGRVVYVTNRHVIEGGNRIVILRQYPRVELIRATVMRLGAGVRDVALIAARHAPIPTVALSDTLPAEGTRIGIAGYPRTQLAFGSAGLGLSPSLHTGTVNALPAGGFYIEYDALTEPGNSGGPLFDLDSGRVEGIVVLKVGKRENNLAIAVPEMLAVASNARVAVRIADASPVDAERRPNGAPAPTPTPSPISTATSDPSCERGLADFYVAYEAWRGAFNRYIDSSAQTTSAVSSVTNRYAAIGLQVTVAYEVRAIRSVINAEEPKLSAAESDIEAGGATETAQGTDGILRAIHRLDQDDLSWSLQRQSLVNNVASGGSGFQVDQSPQQDARSQQNLIDDGFRTLKFARNCTPAAGHQRRE